MKAHRNSLIAIFITILVFRLFGQSALNDCWDEPNIPVIPETQGPNECQTLLNSQIWTFIGVGETLASDLVSQFGTTTLNGGSFFFTGDLVIDVPINTPTVPFLFTFANATIVMSPGTRIIVRDQARLVLSHATITSCQHLWQGIDIEPGGAITTGFVTTISDAEVAIEIPCLMVQNNPVSITRTTFRGNRVGIRFGSSETDPFSPAFCPPITQNLPNFSQNNFICPNPLKGTANDHGVAGIELINRGITLGTISSQPSFFRHTRFGIRNLSPVVGSQQIFSLNSTINQCRFENNSVDGINQENGSLIIRQCRFTNFGRAGIVQAVSRRLTVNNCVFTLNAPPPLATNAFPTLIGIFVDGTRNNSQINITTNNTFNFNYSNVLQSVRAIAIDGGVGEVGLNTGIAISGNIFNLRGANMVGVFAENGFTTTSEFLVTNNVFTLDNTATQLNYGVQCLGDFINLNISVNDFFAPARLDTDPINFSVGIQASGGFQSDETEISGNTFHENLNSPADVHQPDFWVGIMTNFVNSARICNNTLSNLVHTGWLTGDNMAIRVSNNHTHINAHGFSINGMIGEQNDEMNDWPITQRVLGTAEIATFDVNAGDGHHARCDGNPGLSHFRVHETQSTIQFFPESPFHPRIIIPDIDDEFFEQEITPFEPQDCDMDGFVDINDLDILVASESAALLISAAERSIVEQGLFLRLTKRPELQNVAPVLGDFYSSKANTNVGKFSTIARKTREAGTVNTTLNAQIAILEAFVQEKTDSLQLLFEAQENTVLTGAELAAIESKISSQNLQLANVNPTLNSLYAQLKIEKGSDLTDANTILGTISPNGVHENIQKQVYSIWLDALMNQGGSFNSSQISQLISIAENCPASDGFAPIIANHLLTGCNKPNQGVWAENCYGGLSQNTAIQIFIQESANGGVEERTQSMIFDEPQGLIRFADAIRSIKVFDVLGRAVFSAEGLDSHEIGLESLGWGIYFVHSVSTDGSPFSQKILISH